MTRTIRTRVLVELDGNEVLADEQLLVEQHTDPARGSDGMPWLAVFAGVVDVARAARDTYYRTHPLELGDTADTLLDDPERNATT